MKSVLCTLFNINYLDKGIALYESLENVSCDFILYVLAMDNKCLNILHDLNKPFLIPISLVEFENEKLLEVKVTRSFGEYCFTCSSSLVKFVLTTFHEESCTYIDADLYFYSDPSKIIKEIYDRNASVLVVGHRFNWYESSTAKKVGKYCVEFTTFKNDSSGNKLLDFWISQCLESCELLDDGIHYGDQKYLDNWLENYDFVIETQNMGAGVAPWNIRQYKLVKHNSVNNSYELRIRGLLTELVFYHFENIKYISKTKIDISVFRGWGIDESLVFPVYKDYLTRLDRIKDDIYEKYGIEVLVKRHPAVKTVSKNLYSMLSHLKCFYCFLMSGLPTKIYKNKNVVEL